MEYSLTDHHNNLLLMGMTRANFYLLTTILSYSPVNWRQKTKKWVRNYSGGFVIVIRFPGHIIINGTHSTKSRNHFPWETNQFPAIDYIIIIYKTWTMLSSRTSAAPKEGAAILVGHSSSSSSSSTSRRAE